MRRGAVDWSCHLVQMLRPTKALIIIPAFNEGSTVGEVAARTIELGYPVCVVDDGSRDDTAEAAERAGATVVAHDARRGRGRAVRSGFAYALANDYDLVVVVDADAQHDVRDVPTLVSCMDLTGAAFVVGSRFTHPAGTYRIHHWRRLAMHIVTKRVSLVTGTRFTDSTSGFCAVRRPLLDQFADSYPTDFLAGTAGVLVSTCLAGWLVVETPVRMRRRRVGRSKTGIFRSIVCLVVLLSRIERLRWTRSPAAIRISGQTSASPAITSGSAASVLTSD
jgi:glycosyltransferase involved in cell wall biosynthesis